MKQKLILEKSFDSFPSFANQSKRFFILEESREENLPRRHTYSEAQQTNKQIHWINSLSIQFSNNFPHLAVWQISISYFSVSYTFQIRRNWSNKSKLIELLRYEKVEREGNPTAYKLISRRRLSPSVSLRYFCHASAWIKKVSVAISSLWAGKGKASSNLLWFLDLSELNIVKVLKDHAPRASPASAECKTHSKLISSSLIQNLNS